MVEYAVVMDTLCRQLATTKKRGGCTSHKTVNISWILIWKVKTSNSQKRFP